MPNTISDLSQFKGNLHGQLITSHDGDYEEARRVGNGMIDKRPELIVRCTDKSDVINAVNFARADHLLTAICGGGHNVAGFGTCDGGMVIDLSPMKDIAVDAASRTARAEAGLTWASSIKRRKCEVWLPPAGWSPAQALQGSRSAAASAGWCANTG